VAPTILIVDDHADFRRRARRMLEAEGYEVIGEAADGAGGVDAALALRPELVLLDLQLPDVSGFTVAERIAAGGDPPAVIMISTREAADLEELAISHGALGFVGKADLSGSAIERLLAAPGHG
jgi:DNA-binding NarL/FixJ family response regulator